LDLNSLLDETTIAHTCHMQILEIPEIGLKNSGAHFRNALYPQEMGMVLTGVILW